MSKKFIIIIAIIIASVLAISIALLITTQLSIHTKLAFEAVSAICTVGLTAGVTPVLGMAAQGLIIAFMYFGRVGILTLSLGFLMGNKAKDRFQYADTNLLIG